MAKKSIKPFYDSQKWKIVRQQKMLSANYRCEKCGQVAEEVHHIIEINEININDTNITLNENNLLALCKNCHNQKHDRFRKSVIKFDKNGNMKLF